MSLASFLVTALVTSMGVLAADTQTCSLDKKCPESAPCCSQYGQCGTGAYCLGGCDPRMSFGIDSCAPEPVCQSKTYNFDNDDRFLSTSKYLGDSSKTDWVYQGTPLINNGELLLTMPKNSVGTVMATSTYMWYGNVKARIKTARGAGVVTAFILMSDVKDEIDYEWIGVDLGVAQTNYFFQGITDWGNGGNITDISDTFNDWHTYEISWTPDQIDWLVDGVVGRTFKKSDTWNSTEQRWNPHDTARVQLSIWPGGLASNEPGTIAWAGGEIDWDGEDIKNNGYYYATVDSVTVECYNAKSAPGTNKGTSYTYSDIKGTNDTVIDGSEKTILSSFEATGSNMTAGSSDNSESNDSSQVPGGSNVPVSGGGSTAASGESSGSSSSSSSSSSSDCGNSGFSQDCSSSSSSSSTTGSSTTTSAASVGRVGFSLGLVVISVWCF